MEIQGRDEVVLPGMAHDRRGGPVDWTFRIVAVVVVRRARLALIPVFHPVEVHERNHVDEVTIQDAPGSGRQ